MNLLSKKYLTLLFFVSNFFIYAQQGWWTWVGGNNTSNAAGNFGTIGVAAPTNQPPALYHASYWTDLQGHFWIFGGGDLTNNQYCALWMYDPITNQWTWVKGPNTTQTNGNYGAIGVPAVGNFPGSRAWGATSWVDNAGDLWLFGGFGFDAVGTQGILNDLWRYNIATNTWTWVKGPNVANQPGVYGIQGTANLANVPESRYETSVSWTDNNGDLWLFGGENFSGKLNDLWRYNIASNQWTWMKGSNTPGAAGNYGIQGVASNLNEPPARLPFARWKDYAGNLWMMGGRDNNNAFLNDMWKYNVATNQWTWMRGANTANSTGSYGTKCVSSPSNDPAARDENRVCWVDTCGNFWMFGGYNGTTAFNDLWFFDVQLNQWTWASGNGPSAYGTLNVPAATNLPIIRYGGAAFQNPNGELWFFGGRTVPNAMENDMWKFVIDTACTKCIDYTVIANFNSSSQNGCPPLTVNFTNTSVNANSWSWDFGDGNTSNAQHPSNTYLNSGQYTVTLIATNGVKSDTIVFTNYVTVYPVAVAASQPSKDTLCVGEVVGFSNTSTNATSYSWNFGNGNTSTNTTPSQSYNVAGNYTVTLIAISANGCNDTITIPIHVKPNQSFSQNVVICTGSNYTLPGGNVVSSAGTYIDTISAVNGCDSIITTNLTVNSVLTTTQNPVLCNGNSFTLPSGIIVSAAGIYTDTLLSTSGCDSIITTNLQIKPNSNSNQTINICSGNSYTLPSGNVVSTSGVYIDTILSSNGCDSIITTNLTVNNNPSASVSANITINQGDSTNIVASGGGTYTWYPANGLSNSSNNSTFAFPLSTTTYCVIITNSAGCKDTACVTVTVIEPPCPTAEKLNVPNAFSPNADGVNDDFCLQGWTTCLKEFNVAIFNRWGEKVFESKDPNFCWDGKFQNTIMDAQVFVYYIKAKFLNMDKPIVKKGNITLIK